MGALPPFAERKTGTALLCGPAPSLFADFGQARKLFPGAELMALSWTIRAVRAQHVFSHHHEVAHLFRGFGRLDWPGHQFLIHSGIPHRREFRRYPAVDHFWEVGMDSANSAPSACHVLLEMGFDRIVMCGIALDGTPGYAFETGHAVFWQPEIAAHAGELVMADFARRENLDKFAGRVFAMSGAPRKLFGPPPEAA
jgi:hypothetical protein